MKRLFALFSILLNLAACNETIDSASKLSDADLDYLRAKGRRNCLSETAKRTEDQYENSNDELARYTRDDSWKLEKKKGSEVEDTTFISVWKVAPPNFYFLVSVVVDGATTSKFYKITTTTNTDIFKDLQEKKCDSTEKDLTVKESGTSTILTREEEPVDIGDDTRTDTQTIYTHNSDYPGFFGFVANKKWTVKKLDEDDTVTATTVYEYVVTRLTNEPTRSTDITTYPNRKYCMITFAPENSTDYDPPRAPKYTLPIVEKCETDINVTIDADGDSVADFIPATELTL